MKKALLNATHLEILAPEGVHVGGSQEWYPEKWQRMSGCGPIAASNLIWYLARSHSSLQSLCEVGNADPAHFLTLMKEMITFVTPGMGGVNSSRLFVQGAIRYSEAHGVALNARVLEIPNKPRCRPSPEQLRDFIVTALHANLPVAFLNLSNGALNNLDGWHWVTIIALETDTMIAQISDQGRTLDIALQAWLKTSILGGAMVYLTHESS